MLADVSCGSLASDYPPLAAEPVPPPVAVPAPSIPGSLPPAPRREPPPQVLEQISLNLADAGMQMAQTDPNKLARANLRLSAESPPTRVPRERPAPPTSEDAALVQIETRNPAAP